MYALMTVVTNAFRALFQVLARGTSDAQRRRTDRRAAPLDGGASIPLAKIDGPAVPGPGGPLAAPLSGRPCAWYAVTVLERYRVWRPGPLGPTRAVRHVKVAEYVSGPLFVTGDTVTVRVDIHDAERDLGTPAFAAFEETLPARVAEIVGTVPRRRNVTIGYVIEEQAVEGGEPMHIVGRPRTEAGEIVIGKPPGRPLILTRARINVRQER